ncbi:MAG: 3-oxoacyl-[acyl-carrier-protein] synthase III C-terminal domain-containing protein [Verrucomicrobiota bacterium]|nr:3-oxoacyl-[acyl-carrier-protein] synthase III C-terminal domain-containing protein [Verrucomicrobiota bacterium]
MYLHALATAVPDATYSQMECWEIAQHSSARERLSRRSVLILQSILKGESGIATRHFAIPAIKNVFDLNADQLNTAFREEAPMLAGRALTVALEKAGMNADKIDALLVCTCTGYLCPGVSSYVAEQLGLRTDAYLQDLVGLGCGAAIPTLRSAQAVLAAHPDAVVACIAVEICSAAFYLDDDPGVIISACLFADGAAATLWRSTPGPTGLGCRAFDTLHLPAERDKLRFEQKDGKLRNLLDPGVPALAANAVSQLFARTKHDDGALPISQIISHPGGRDVLNALEEALPHHPLTASRTILRSYGNMSSPSVLFALEEALRSSSPDNAGDWWLVSFGAGFSAHSCRFGVGTGGSSQ